MPQEFADFLAVRGNLTRLADALGITKGAVAQWDKVPIKRVTAVEKETGIDRAILRPDFFAPDTVDAA